MYKNLKYFEQKVALIDSGLIRYTETINRNLTGILENLQKICLVRDCKVNDLAENLIKLKNFADNLPYLNEDINGKIDKILKSYCDDQKDKGMALAKLSLELEKDVNGVGSTIISEHKIFKGQSISLFNQAVQSRGIEYVLEKLEGNDLDNDSLKSAYDQFAKTYKNLIEHYILLFERNATDKSDLLNELCRKMKVIINSKSKIKKADKDSYEWDEDLRFKIVNLI